jgi:hypothetical protein
MPDLVMVGVCATATALNRVDRRLGNLYMATFGVSAAAWRDRVRRSRRD